MEETGERLKAGGWEGKGKYKGDRINGIYEIFFASALS
jgi:hypothetical protein